MKSIAIIGAGGMARDALHTLDALGLAAAVIGFFETPEIVRERDVSGLPVRATTALDIGATDLLVAVGSGTARSVLVAGLPPTARYPRYVHPSVSIGRNVEMGSGTLVCAGSIMTGDIRLGRHVQLNIGTFVTHDCVLGDFVTTAPGVRISGNCRIGPRSFIGTNASIREGTTIDADTVVGMGAVVTRDLSGGGVWIGNPARRIR